MQTFIDSFMHDLAATQTSAALVNPYAGSDAHSKRRRHNLRRYLHAMAAARPPALLVGEAPGYRGCRLTGIPFYSPTLLPTDEGYLPIAEWPHIQNEASATILRTALRPCQPPPLIWNACPFHPHRPGRPQSNRTPKAAEIALGEPFLRRLYAAFTPIPLVAVGQKAAHALTRWELPHTTVRHPSHGGKQAFITGLTNLGIIPQ